jgi:peptidoglycan/LPS O-acetylase OafA/YrhL
VWTRAFEGAARSAVVVLGVYAVEAFFLISGFCFFHLYADARFDAQELGRFHVRRFFRIAPLFYCALLLGVAFGLDQSVGPRVDAARVLENLTLSFGLVHPNHAMVLGGWSIGIEYAFYFALPVLLRVARFRPALYALGVLLSSWAVPYTFGAVQAADEARRFHAYVVIPNHAFLFVLGAIVADLRARIPHRLPPLLALAMIAVAGAAAARVQAPFLDHLEVMVGDARVRYVAVTTFTVLVCAFASPLRGRVLAPFEWLGAVSYSLYLMHPYAWLLVEGSLADQVPMLRFAVGAAAALALATVVRAVIERPMDDLGRRLAATISRSRGRSPLTTT